MTSRSWSPSLLNQSNIWVMLIKLKQLRTNFPGICFRFTPDDVRKKTNLSNKETPPPFCWLNSLLLNFLYPCCDIMNSPIILEKWNNLYKSEMVKPVTKVHPPSSPEISVVFSLSTKILRRWLQNLRYQISCYHVLSSVIFLIKLFYCFKIINMLWNMK